jgi:hypothetical protein
MGETVIVVEDNGQVSDQKVTVSPGDRVIWKPRTGGNKIDIFFDDKVPFKELKWANKQETNEDEIDGKVKGHKKGTTTHYPYNTIRFFADPAASPPTSGPELIVDGGPPFHKKKKPKKPTTNGAKKRKKAKKAKPLARAKKAKKSKAKKAAKSRARKKR